MKTAEEYLKNITASTTREELYEIGRQIQIDAIDVTVKMCAEQSLLSIDGIVEKSNGQTYLCDEGNHYTETWINIDKQSILNCAKILKKEIK